MSGFDRFNFFPVNGIVDRFWTVYSYLLAYFWKDGKRSWWNEPFSMAEQNERVEIFSLSVRVYRSGHLTSDRCGARIRPRQRCAQRTSKFITSLPQPPSPSWVPVIFPSNKAFCCSILFFLCQTVRICVLVCWPFFPLLSSCLFTLSHTY